MGNKQDVDGKIPDSEVIIQIRIRAIDVRNRKPNVTEEQLGQLRGSNRLEEHACEKVMEMIEDTIGS